MIADYLQGSRKLKVKSSCANIQIVTALITDFPFIKGNRIPVTNGKERGGGNVVSSAEISNNYRHMASTQVNQFTSGATVIFERVVG